MTDYFLTILTISGMAKTLLNSFKQIGTLKPKCWTGWDWTEPPDNKSTAWAVLINNINKIVPYLSPEWGHRSVFIWKVKWGLELLIVVKET